MIHETIDLFGSHEYKDAAGTDFLPKMVTYVLRDVEKAPAVVIAPGGGYSFTSWREAEPIALAFNSFGFHAFVVHYSCSPNAHPKPVAELSRAVAMVRKNSDKWKIDGDKIAVCGFSAGGHLAATLGVHHNQSYVLEAAGINPGDNKPNALILCYPVISSADCCAHAGSFSNLLAGDRELIEHLSLERHVSTHVPPCFIWHTFEDATVPVENSLVFAAALREKDVPFELHIYQKGGHGLSLAKETTADGRAECLRPHLTGWFSLCADWLRELFQG